MAEDYKMCFACGQQNPIGLKLKFTVLGDDQVARFCLPEVYQGYEGVVHGGIVATMLDEAMAWAVLAAGAVAVTGRLEVNYARPVQVNAEYTLRGRVEETKKRLFRCRAEISDADGNLCASATSTYVNTKVT